MTAIALEIRMYCLRPLRGGGGGGGILQHSPTAYLHLITSRSLYPHTGHDGLSSCLLYSFRFFFLFEYF